MEDFYYLILQPDNYLKFDPVNQITNVFFDDCRQQLFIVKSASIVCKSVNENGNFSFSLNGNGNLIAVKFSDKNNILAVQRNENNIELIEFKNNQIIPNSSIIYETRKNNTIIYGFVWTSAINEFIIVTADSVELFQINMPKRQMKSLKSVSQSNNWYSYNRSNFLLLSSNNGLLLTPVLVRQGSLTKLTPIQIDDGQSVSERDVICGSLYDKPAILILRTTRNRTLEIFVYMLLSKEFKKSHILQLGFSGRVAISIIDSVIIVHHQTSKISLLFDIALTGEVDSLDKSITIHSPLVISGKSIRPFSIKLPSVSLKESTMNFELYSVNWVIFSDIIIDVKLGYLFKLELLIDKVQIGDKIKLVDFLMHRSNSKSHLMTVLSQLISPDDNETHLLVLELIFDKLNKVYKLKLDFDLSKMQALPSPSTFKSFSSPAVVASIPEHPKEIVIEQNDMLQIFNTIHDKHVLEKVLLSYINSLVKNSIVIEYDLSKMLIITLVGSQKINDLQQILSYQVLHESKILACFLLSLANYDPLISQMALDMLKRLNAHEIIVEILLEQGKIIDAIRLTKQYSNCDTIPARKYLEAALKVDDKMVFYSVFNYFVARNQRLRGTDDFMKSKR
jgi:hypothetical protein